MEYSLQAIYYLFRSYINLLLQVEVTDNGVTVGGVLFAVLLLSGLLLALGLLGPNMSSRIGRGSGGMDDQLSLPDNGIQGDGFTMR